MTKIKDLLDYYKKQIYEHGYHICERDKKYGTDNRNVDNDIYFNDEMDYYICADYYGMMGEFSHEDEKLLDTLGFKPEDFENE